MKTKTDPIKGHQGDVQFSTIANLPKGAVAVANKPIALGEHSGHMHVLTGPDVQMFELDGRLFTVVGGDGARLQHVHESNFTDKCWTTTEEVQIADHKSHKLPAGVYEFWIQNAFNPYSKLMEAVID
jgi:hypothetical protein